MRNMFLLGLLAFSLQWSVTNTAEAYGADMNSGPLNGFEREDLFCGKGWNFPVLIWGERPTSVCIIKTRRRNRFGGSFGF